MRPHTHTACSASCQTCPARVRDQPSVLWSLFWTSFGHIESLPKGMKAEVYAPAMRCCNMDMIGEMPCFSLSHPQRLIQRLQGVFHVVSCDVWSGDTNQAGTVSMLQKTHGTSVCEWMPSQVDENSLVCAAVITRRLQRQRGELDGHA